MLARYRALPVTERRALWSATWRLILIRLSLLGSIQNTRARFGGRAASLRSIADPEEWSRWQMRALALRRAGSRLPGVHCLARSLALRWWMRSSGIDAECLIGVRNQDGRIDSHAWVEVGGRPVDETPEIVARYQVLKTRAIS